MSDYAYNVKPIRVESKKHNQLKVSAAMSTYINLEVVILNKKVVEKNTVNYYQSTVLSILISVSTALSKTAVFYVV